MTGALLWDRYHTHNIISEELGFGLDIGRVRFPEDLFARMHGPLASALDEMAKLEAGGIANPDEKRMVGHYWLRAPHLAPTPELTSGIIAAQAEVRARAADLRGRFLDVLHLGVGGSSLGPRLLCDLVSPDDDAPGVHVIDNPDPDGVHRTLSGLRGGLARTAVSVVSKSGFTPTTKALVAELSARYAAAGLDFGAHALATTVPGSELDEQARRERWIATLPLWDWCGGRTSITSPVGLLPLALRGGDVEEFLDGAASMDRLTRVLRPQANPAAVLALMWHWLGNGRGDKAMILLPYGDRFSLLPRYIQQLVMESIGKKLDRSGSVVEQGLTVYGHKGSTDQHSYLQQVRHGRNDAFVTFLEFSSTATTCATALDDVLFANLLGMRESLHADGRDSITLTFSCSPLRAAGAVIALYERAVGLYAELIDVNAYHQPGVDKFVAADVLDLQAGATAALAAAVGPLTAVEIATALGRPDDVELVYRLLSRLSRLGGRGVAMIPGSLPDTALFSGAAS